MVYMKCPFFSDEVIELGEEKQNNYTKPFGNMCYSCKETNCEHNSIRL
jgi:hypothetical protein